MNLKEMASSAAANQAKATREQAKERKEKSLTSALEKWDDQFSGFGRLAKDGFVATRPERDAFERVDYPGLRAFGFRDEKVYGWRVEVDGIPFLFAENSRYGSLWLIHDCPDCGVTGASNFYGLAELGVLLTKGPKSGHKCMERETREVAYAIGSAARDLKRDPHWIAERALTDHQELIARIQYRR